MKGDRVRAWLCAHGIHRWYVLRITCAGMGRVLKCAWCGKEESDAN